MNITKKDIAYLRFLYLKRFKRLITDEEAVEMGGNLLNLTYLAYTYEKPRETF